ncbi:DedA family protein [Patescibacteria group bacterium]
MNWFLKLIAQNGYTSIFLGGLLEEIIVPIPSPLVGITGGALLIKEKALGAALWAILTHVSLPFALGATIGITLAYFLAFWGGKLVVDKFKKFLGFSWNDVTKLQAKYFKGKHDELTIVILRAIPVIPVSLVSVVCGGLRYDLKTFYLASFVGLLVRSFILGVIGWRVGSAYESWIHGLDKAETFVSIGLVLILGLGLAFLYKNREKFLKKRSRKDS